MEKDFNIFIDAVIQRIKQIATPLSMEVEIYDGRYETDEALKIVGDEVGCYVGIESLQPDLIAQQNDDNGKFYAILNLILFIEVRKVGGFDDENAGNKAVPMDFAMEVFAHLRNNPIVANCKRFLTMDGKPHFSIKSFSGFDTMVQSKHFVVVGGTISYPIIIQTETDT